MNDKTDQALTDELRRAAKSAAPYGTAMIGASHLNEAADTIDTLRAQVAQITAERKVLPTSEAAQAATADVGEPVAFAHFSENGKISLWLWAPERPRDLDGNAAQPLYTADQLTAAADAER